MKKIIGYLIKQVLIFMIIYFFSSCDTRTNYERNYGEPKYKVTLLDNFGNEIETKYAHEKYESIDWGMHKNYEFRYHGFRYFRNSTKYGSSYLDSWEWNKGNVKIERLK